MRIALIVIDMQWGYFQTGSLKSQRARVAEACNGLLDAAREHGASVYMVVTEHARDRSTWTLNMLEDGVEFLTAGSEETEVLPELHQGGTRIVKTRDSAFFGTGLADDLRAKGITKLVLCGVSTHSCVMQTAMAAYSENFVVVLARDAIATHDERYHEPVLGLLAQEYRQPSLTNAEIIRMFDDDPPQGNRIRI